MILKLVIGVSAVISAAGAAWLVVEDVQFKVRARGHRWAALPWKRIVGLLFGPPAAAFLVAIILGRYGFHTGADIWGRLAGAVILSFWAVALGSAARNRAIVSVGVYSSLAGLERLDGWSSKYLGSWWAMRIIVASAVGALAPGYAVGLPVMILFKLRGLTPAVRVFLGLEPRPASEAPG